MKKLYKKLQRVKKNNLDKIWDQINQEYWTNIENLVIEYYLIKNIKEEYKTK